jgi:hypothetical protein
MDPSPQDVRTIPLGRGVVEGESQTRGPLEERPDDLG